MWGLGPTDGLCLGSGLVFWAAQHIIRKTMFLKTFYDVIWLISWQIPQMTRSRFSIANLVVGTPGFVCCSENAPTEVGASSTSKPVRSWFRRVGGRQGDPDDGDPRHLPPLSAPADIGKNGKRSAEVSRASVTTEKAHVHLPSSPMPGTPDGLLSADN